MSALLAIGQNFRGLYPASNGEGLTLREGVVEKVAESYVVVKIESGYRTFQFGKLLRVGDDVSITKSDNEVISGRILSHSGDAMYVGPVASKLSEARYVHLNDIASYTK